MIVFYNFICVLLPNTKIHIIIQPGQVYIDITDICTVAFYSSATGTSSATKYIMFFLWFS